MNLRQRIYDKIANSNNDFKNISILFELKLCIKAINKENLFFQENNKLKELHKQKETYLNVIINNLDKFRHQI